MKKLIVIILTLCSINSKAQNDTNNLEDFLTFIQVKRNIKTLVDTKILYDESNFQLPLDSLNYSQIDMFYQTAICYWIKASVYECDSLQKAIQKSTLTWNEMGFKDVKIISNEHSEVNYHMLSEPIFFKTLAVIKVKSHDKMGFSSEIEIYEKTNNSWTLKQTLNPKTN